MNIEISEENETVVVRPSEEIHFDNYKEVEEKLNSLIENGKKNITLDMRNVPHIYSMTLGMFNKTAQTLSEKGGKFSLANISREARKVLKATRLDGIIAIR